MSSEHGGEAAKQDAGEPEPDDQESLEIAGSGRLAPHLAQTTATSKNAACPR
jgi:hypothetical protein